MPDRPHILFLFTDQQRAEDWRIVIGRDGQTLQLFDMKNDPLEQTNLGGRAGVRASIVNKAPLIKR